MPRRGRRAGPSVPRRLPRPSMLAAPTSGGRPSQRLVHIPTVPEIGPPASIARSTSTCAVTSVHSSVCIRRSPTTSAACSATSATRERRRARRLAPSHRPSCMGSCGSRSGEAASGDLGGLSGCAERGQGEVRSAREDRWKVGIPASPKSVRGLASTPRLCCGAPSRGVQPCMEWGLPHGEATRRAFGWTTRRPG